MSGRSVQMQQGWMRSYNVWNDWLLNLQLGAGTIYGQFVPYVNINKQSSMNLSQVNSLLGYQASVRSTDTILFYVLLAVGLVGIGLGVFALIKFFQAKKIGEVTGAN